MKRLYIETGLLAVGMISYLVGGLYFIHKMDIAIKAFIMGTVR